MPCRALVTAAAATLLLACHRDPIQPADDRLTVDATVYARGLCSLKCYRLTECPEHAPAADCEQGCIDEALENLAGDPCWAEWIEVRRCGVRWSQCAEVPDETIPADAPESCAARVEQLAQCEAR